ncbi:MAG: SDR family oxidoreductase [Anaerolineae bacterium]|nr:SDR family oxidoreductase [Phycisphaerae bacterium]
MFSLDGKTAVVTGGGSGIGEAIAHRFAGAGAQVYVLDRDEAAAKRVVDAINAAEKRANYIACDVTSEASVKAASEQVIQQSKRCDVLVNNAGIGHVGSILATTAEDLERLWAVNVRGVFNLSKRFLPTMIEQGGGSIVNIASVGGVVALKDRMAYCTTKFAVVGMTKCMALDHAASRVRVNCICPGRVETPFVQARLKQYADPKKAYEDMAASHPLNRMAKPDEIAAAALYLASDEASFVTGSALLIDGGLSVGK